MDGLVLGQQLSAGRALINLTQEELARAAGLHVNSIRYLERQKTHYYGLLEGARGTSNAPLRSDLLSCPIARGAALP
jgi:transcriptional regulator with XRE-family HTH domain